MAKSVLSWYAPFWRKILFCVFDCNIIDGLMHFCQEHCNNGDCSQKILSMRESNTHLQESVFLEPNWRHVEKVFPKWCFITIMPLWVTITSLYICFRPGRIDDNGWTAFGPGLLSQQSDFAPVYSTYVIGCPTFISLLCNKYILTVLVFMLIPLLSSVVVFVAWVSFPISESHLSDRHRRS